MAGLLERSPLSVRTVSTEDVDIWIAYEDSAEVDYCYGGTRLLSPNTNNDDAVTAVRRLALHESALKNRLINLALLEGALRDVEVEVASVRFLRSRVGGARCVIRPRNELAYRGLQNPTGNLFKLIADRVFKVVADVLSELEGLVKLTPDYGRFAGVADMLFQYTPHVLGINRAFGGCGGKSSYSSSGVLAAVERYRDDRRLTFIGAAGAMGSGVLLDNLHNWPHDTLLCDLEYGSSTAVDVDGRLLRATPGEWGLFTKTCLERGGLILATTVGKELENSEWEHIPAGARLLLAHNLCLPSGSSGVGLARALAERRVHVVPGQILTLGGALTSRLEWYSREARIPAFDKPSAHAIVRHFIGFILDLVERTCRETRATPFEAMLNLAEIALRD